MWLIALKFESHDSPSHYPELRSGLLQWLSWGVQCTPLIGELRSSAFPALQEQRGPHHIKESKHHTTDIPAGLRAQRQKYQSYEQ